MGLLFIKVFVMRDACTQRSSVELKTVGVSRWGPRCGLRPLRSRASQGTQKPYFLAQAEEPQAGQVTGWDGGGQIGSALLRGR